MSNQVSRDRRGTYVNKSALLSLGVLKRGRDLAIESFAGGCPPGCGDAAPSTPRAFSVRSSLQSCHQPLPFLSPVFRAPSLHKGTLLSEECPLLRSRQGLLLCCCHYPSLRCHDMVGPSPQRFPQQSAWPGCAVATCGSLLSVACRRHTSV